MQTHRKQKQWEKLETRGKNTKLLTPEKQLLTTLFNLKILTFDGKFFEVCLTFSFYLLATFSQNVMVKNVIDSKLWYFVNFAVFW